MVQHHVHHNGVDLEPPLNRRGGVTEDKLDVAPTLLRGQGAGAGQQIGGVVQRDHLVKAGGELSQKSPFPRADLQDLGLLGQICRQQYFQGWLGIVVVGGNQLLLGPELVGRSEERRVGKGGSSQRE